MYEHTNSNSRGMSERFTAISWNVQGEIGVSDSRMKEQLDFLETHTSDVDLALFQAVNYETSEEGVREGQLEALQEFFSERGFHIVHTGDWAKQLAESGVQPHSEIEGAHNRCNLIASRWPLTRRPLTLRNRGNRKPRGLNYYYSHFPEKMLVAEVDFSDATAFPVDTLEIWNVGIINGANWGEEKLNMLETVYGRIHLQTTKTGNPVLLGGDFNAPKQETRDREIIPHGQNSGQYTQYPYYGDPHYLRDQAGDVNELAFSLRWQLAEARIFDPEIGDWEMQDAYWSAGESRRESSIEDYTHVLSNGSPARKRLDHIFVSAEFDVLRCELWNGEMNSVNGFRASDHAPVVTTLSIRG